MLPNDLLLKCCRIEMESPVKAMWAGLCRTWNEKPELMLTMDLKLTATTFFFKIIYIGWLLQLYKIKMPGFINPAF